ncbi:MAG: TolC family protein [Myxococcota bacterium]
MWTVGFLMTFSTSASAQSSFEEIVRDARTDSPTAQMSAADLDIARHRKGRSVARLMPQINLSDTQTYRVNNPDRYSFGSDEEPDCEDDPTNIFCLPLAITDGQITLPENTLSNILSLSGTLPISSGSITNVMQQNLSKQKTQVQVDAQDERLVQDLINQYAELQYSVGALIMYEESLMLAEETLRAVEGRRDAGEATALDVDQAQLDVDQAALSIAQIERSLPNTLDQLALTSGRPAEQDVRVCPFSDNIDTGGESLDLARATSLESVELDLRMDTLDRTSARLDILPTLTFIGSLSYSGNGEDFQSLSDSFIYDNWYVGANLSMTLFDGLNRHHVRREAVASLEKTEIEVETERRSLALEDQKMALDLRDVAEDLDLSARAVSLQEREVTASRSLYFDGGATTFDMYTQSRSMLEQFRLQYLGLQRQQLQLTAQRWIKAGQGDALLETLFARERAHAAAIQCRTVSSQ